MEPRERHDGGEAGRGRSLAPPADGADLDRLRTRIEGLRPRLSTPVGEPAEPPAKAPPKKDRVQRTWRRDAAALVVVFMATRVILTVIGLVSRDLVPGPVVRPRPVGVGPSFSSLPFLDVWAEWDSSWYLSIAKFGYDALPQEGPYANYAFFPLYPLLARSVGWLTGGPFVGGLVVSNAAFLLACTFLYRLVVLDHDEETARRAVKYLFAAPAAFVFSAMLTESLFLALAVMCFYFARTKRWWAVGVLGFLLALSRGPGLLVAIPLLWTYLRQCRFSLRRVRPDVLWLALFPAGVWVFMAINEAVTGDALAFTHIQVTAWGHRAQNPVVALWRAVSGDNPVHRFNGWYTVCVLTFGLVLLRRLGTAYGLFVLVSVLPPMSYGAWEAMTRYTVVAFPLYVVAARFTNEKPRLDQAVTIGLVLLQGFLMSQWANNGPLVI